MTPRRSASPTTPRPVKRGSKACETCRSRKVRCSGQQPCTCCMAAGIASSCQIRDKARPSRSAIHPRSEPASHFQRPPPASEDDLVLNPLGTISVNLAIWCLSYPDINFNSLDFCDQDRLDMLSLFAPPIPIDTTFEDDLMTTFFERSGFATLQFTDKPQLLSLYARYRALPNSLSEDQLALIYAALCAARALQIMSDPSASPAEDVTYYHKACDMLRRWNRPSIYACWALFCLAQYSQAFGGALDSRKLVQQMANHIKDLGIHRKSTVSLYRPDDLVNVLLSACCYLDIFTAGLLGMTPCMPFDIVDVDPILMTAMFPQQLIQVVQLEDGFLRNLADPMIDTKSPAYISSKDLEFSEGTRLLRLVPLEGKDVRLLWAELRYLWMKILLHAPLFPSSTPQLGRCISETLHLYMEVDDALQYRSCWPQLRQLGTIGHLLILVSAQGGFHRKEATALWDLLLNFLDRDPHAAELIKSLRQAAAIFGINSRPARDRSEWLQEVSFLPPNTNTFPFNFDPLSMFTIFDEDFSSQRTEI